MHPDLGLMGRLSVLGVVGLVAWGCTCGSSDGSGNTSDPDAGGAGSGGRGSGGAGGSSTGGQSTGGQSTGGRNTGGNGTGGDGTGGIGAGGQGTGGSADAGNALDAGEASVPDSGGPPDAEAGPVVCGGMSVGLVAHYLAENSTSDATGRGHDATFEPASDAATLAYAAGHAGQAFDFASDGHLTTADAADLDVKVGLTIAAWTRVDTASTGLGSHRDLVSKDGEGYVNGVGSDFERQYELIVSDQDRLRAHVGTASGFEVINGATPVPIGTWIHVAMTYDAASGELVVYLNHAVDGTHTVPEGSRCILDTPQPLRLGGGAPPGYDQLFLDGLLDDVRVYDRALTAAEIAAL
jgi:hypothetical protein